MSLKEAKKLDSQYEIHRKDFVIPTFKSLNITNEKFPEETESIYLCGNSLGLLPNDTRKAINDELDAWGQRGVESHFDHPGDANGLTSWVDIDLPLLPLLAPIVGAKESEVAVMGSLTSNLNALLMSFYKPSNRRTKIMFEKQAFPSDFHAFSNVVKLHGYDESHLIQLSPREGEDLLRTEDILDSISRNHENLAVICLPGIQFYTGQYFDIRTITEHAKKYGVVVGWDLAHAVGNVDLKLHDWDIDFAAWCSYKYLNAGPGGIGGIFVHEKHTKDNSRDHFEPRLAGWWGTDLKNRFKMCENFDPMNSALSYRQSNPSVIDCVALKASLEIFKRAGGIVPLRERSIALTLFLENLLVNSKYCLNNLADKKRLGFKILTSHNQNERGCQLSLLFQPHSDDPLQDTMSRVFQDLHDHAIICDERKPDVIRISPTPLYNTFEETFYATQRLFEALDHISKKS
ncbi:uncharacterized protein PRCAT00000732001 [Priceomyces carsonii]|uniref:uncharacterized protein n=1 Tax=Priceomyces carsonii TaxID=28549 RepID=UPI002ED9DA0B|nr:unnamed protein product [Priceomyces carsonii]